MTRGRQLSAAAALAVVGGVTLAVYLYWQYAVSLIMIGAALRGSRHLIAKHFGIRRRPKSSWSSLGRTVAIMFAAWNTRYFKPKSKLAKKVIEDALVEHDAKFGEVPF